MDNEREEEEEIDLTIAHRTSSIDSLEQNESNTETLRSVSGCQKWINTDQKIRVENAFVFRDYLDQSTRSISNKIPVEIEDDDEELSHSSRTEISLNHFDVQLQVNNGQLHQMIRYEVFSSILPNQLNAFKMNQSSQTIEPEMDMDGEEGRRNGRSNGYSQQYSNGNNNQEGGYRGNWQSNGSGGSGDGNGSNSNRNNNNSRRPNDGDSEDNDDDDDDESDENLARRLGFRPIDNETLRIINRLRSLTNRQSFDRRDFENVQYLIDELIRVQHLENSSQEQLEKIIHYLKLHRILRTKSQALAFIQERLPRRSSRGNNDPNSNVFDIWRERERRGRLDSKDSLEDEGQNSNEQQYREVVETHYSTPSTNTSNGTSKVKQMAKHIDTRSVSSRARDHGRSESPSPPNLNRDSHGVRHEIHVEDRTRTRRNLSPTSASEQRRVRDMIDRLESSSTPATNSRTTKKSALKKSFRDDRTNDSVNFTSAPSMGSRVTRREEHESSLANGSHGGFIFRPRSPHEDIYGRENQSNVTRFELDRDEISSRGRRIASGTSMDDYVTSLLPGAETSISMVREVRARLYDDDSALSRTDVDNIPVKVDLETLYILEQKSERKPLPSNGNVYIPVTNHGSALDRHDFAMQTNIPITTIKPSNRPIGTQVERSIEQNTVAAQTTDSLHRQAKERLRLLSSGTDEEGETSKIIRTTTTTTRVDVKRRHSSHHTSEDEDDDESGSAVIHIDEKDNFELRRHSSTDEQVEDLPEQRSSFGQVTSRLRIEPLRDINRQVVRRHLEQTDYESEEHRSAEVYEIHTRGACKCLVVSYEERTQHGPETRFEKQLKRIERTYTEEELRSAELHVIVTASNGDYQLVRRDYGSHVSIDDENLDRSKQPTITIHYYTKEGHRMRTEQARNLEHLPLFIRCEIEYELNHFGSAQLIVLSVTNAERRQMNMSLKQETVDETITRTGGRLAPNSVELGQEISRKLAEPISLLHLVDYSSRDDYNQTNSTDLRRVSRTDVGTSLRLVQRYRTIIHRLCQLHRSHLRLTTHAEQQRHLILVARDEYYLLDLASQAAAFSSSRSDIQQRQHDIFKREVQNVAHQPFDYAKYRRDAAQQQRILEQHYRQSGPPPGHSTEPEFYLGAGRRALIEREIHNMRESIRPHEHAPPRYKNEPKRRSLSISYSGGQRYVRARIIHVKDYYDESHQQQTKQPKDAKEQELFVRVDDYINEAAANSLRRSYSTDYLQEDGPRSRIRYIRIPGETIRIEEKTTYEYQGVMYADLPYSLRYWNILGILDREAREGRPLGSSLPHVIVNDPYRTVIPPLTQQEIRQTAQQVLSPQYYPQSYTDKTLRWFLSRDNRTEIESAKYLQTLNHCRQQQQLLQQQQQQQLLQQQQQQQLLQQQQQQLLQQQQQQQQVLLPQQELYQQDCQQLLLPPQQQQYQQDCQQYCLEHCQQYCQQHCQQQQLLQQQQQYQQPQLLQQQYQQQQHQQHQQQQHQQQQRQANIRVEEGGRTGVAKKYYVTETLVRYEKMPDRLVPVPVTDRAQSIDNIHHRSPSTSRKVQQSFHSQNYLNRSQSQPRVQDQSTTYSSDFRGQLPPMNTPLSRHHSVHELHATSKLSHPPSPSPSLHSLHSNHHHQQQQQQNRRPVAFNTRYQARCPSQPQQNPLFTEVIDSQTGRRILTTSQEQLPTAVRGLLNHYNLNQF